VRIVRGEGEKEREKRYDR